MGGGPIWLDDVSCSGSETRLGSCSRSGGWGNHNCDHGEDAGAVCHGEKSNHCRNLLNVVSYTIDITLVGGGTWYEGRVEVYYNNQWGTICDDSWDMVDATVACKQLGYPLALAFKQSAYFGQGSNRIWLDNVACTGSETRVHSCSSNSWGSNDCSHSEDVGIICQS